MDSMRWVVALFIMEEGLDFYSTEVLKKGFRMVTEMIAGVVNDTKAISREMTESKNRVGEKRFYVLLSG